MPPWHVLLPEPLKERRRRRHVADRLDDDAPIVHFTHGGCLDGTACSILQWIAHDRDRVADVPLQPHQVPRAVDILTGTADDARTLQISDLSIGPDDADATAETLAGLRDDGWTIVWRDHHAGQWADGTRETIEAAVDELLVDTDERYCGADLVQQDLLPDDPFARELAETVRDRDLWLREDPRSDVLAGAMNRLGPHNFAEIVYASRDLDDPRLDEAAEAFQQDLDRQRRQAVEQVEIVEGDRRVGVLYGDYSSSDAAEAIHKAHDTEIEAIFKPHGGVSLRSREGVDVSEVARDFGGGGHAQAAGCTLGLSVPEHLWYWLTGGGGPKPRKLVEALATG